MKFKRIKIFVFILMSTISIISSPIIVNAKSIDLNMNHATIKVMAKEIDCKKTSLGCTDDEDSVAWLLQKILNYIKILGPTLAIVMGSVDFTKAIISSDEEHMKKTEVKFIQRIVAAILLFFIPLIVEVLLNLFGITGSTGGLK